MKDTTAVEKKVIMPRTRMVYDESDVTAITGLTPYYNHKRLDYSSYSASVSHFTDKDNKRVERKDATEMVVKYMRENGIIGAESKVSPSISAEHCFVDKRDGSGDQCSSYSMDMAISIYKL